MKKRDFLDDEILNEFIALHERKLPPSEILRIVYEKFRVRLEGAHLLDLAFYLEAIYGIDAIDLLPLIDQWLSIKSNSETDQLLNMWIHDLTPGSG